MFKTELDYQKLVNLLILHGMEAQYVTNTTYSSAVSQLNTKTVLVYIHGSGEDVILMGDNEIDVVRFKFRKGRRGIR